MSEELKGLKIKTNGVKHLIGDVKTSDKEIAQQKARIEKVKADAEKDDHDTRAQVHAPPRRRARFAFARRSASLPARDLRRRPCSPRWSAAGPPRSTC